jgi:hypothetical protein
MVRLKLKVKTSLRAYQDEKVPSLLPVTYKSITSNCKTNMLVRASPTVSKKILP